MAEPPDFEAMIVRLRAVDGRRELGEALLDQRLVVGIGNMWKVEALFHSAISPWLPLADISDDTLRHLLGMAASLMRAGKRETSVYRRRGRPCRRCGTPIRSAQQGEGARTAYWCPACQAGTAPASA